MEKEEILQKNINGKGQYDEREVQLLNKGVNISTAVMGAVCIAFIVVFGVLRLHAAYFALMATVFSFSFTAFLIKYVYFRKKHEIVAAIIYGVAFLAMVALFVVSLVFGW